MDKKQLEIFEDDYVQATGFFRKLLIKFKEIYYFFQRPLMDFFIRKHLKKLNIPEFFFTKIDYFLKNEGGMFKKYVYKKCDKFYGFKDSKVLVPGVGYGKNMFQLAAFKPKKIIAFDLYDYRKEWSFLKNKIKNKFGVEVEFFKGNFDSIPEEHKKSFDLIITDAVLEHVNNLPLFIKNSKVFLKKGGIFYASFGPLWYGPCGDHLGWKGLDVFNHLLLDKKEYMAKVNELSNDGKLMRIDSYNPNFMFENNLFSYLKVENYFNFFLSAGFKKILAYASIPSRSFCLSKECPVIFKELDKKNFPVFDRFCKGLYFWLKLME